MSKLSRTIKLDISPRARARASAMHGVAQGDGLINNDGGYPLPPSAPDNAADKPAATPIQHNTQSAQSNPGAEPGNVDLSLADTVAYCADSMIGMCEQIKEILGFAVKLREAYHHGITAPTPPDLKKSKNPKNKINNRNGKNAEEF